MGGKCGENVEMWREKNKKVGRQYPIKSEISDFHKNVEKCGVLQFFCLGTYEKKSTFFILFILFIQCGGIFFLEILFMKSFNF
jgi:hypothetical protein